MELDNNEEQLKRKPAAGSWQENDDANHTERFGLWWGLGAAGVVTVGVLALAFYTSYQDGKTEEKAQTVAASSVPHEHHHAHAAVEHAAASMALLNSETQAQGMTAPTEIAASEVVTPLSVEHPVSDQIAASSPAELILAQTDSAESEAKILVENGIVKFYFASGKSELADGSPEALKDVLSGVRDGKKAVVSGYADHTGNAAQNEQLSKERAFKVRDALLAVGVPESSIVMEKPQNHTGSGDKAEARRVEVVLR